ncbi:hypothetical protein GP2143_03888 [marine gamma proteobacterium HTCC2143]|uniref:Uncharacterized protein n=1 Tax=marine gamma proteobacterium HTCC2143 TaxID=247633 RepID=A0YDC9_9GAMM|nr:hypothetical protein GP2143_03888 [marine gamma proteobacterium HTCC2143]
MNLIDLSKSKAHKTPFLFPLNYSKNSESHCLIVIDNIEFLKQKINDIFEKLDDFDLKNNLPVYS